MREREGAVRESRARWQTRAKQKEKQLSRPVITRDLRPPFVTTHNCAGTIHCSKNEMTRKVDVPPRRPGGVHHVRLTVMERIIIAPRLNAVK